MGGAPTGRRPGARARARRRGSGARHRGAGHRVAGGGFPLDRGSTGVRRRRAGDRDGQPSHGLRPELGGALAGTILDLDRRDGGDPGGAGGDWRVDAWRNPSGNRGRLSLPERATRDPLVRDDRRLARAAGADRVRAGGNGRGRGVAAGAGGVGPVSGARAGDAVRRAVCNPLARHPPRDRWRQRVVPAADGIVDAVRHALRATASAGAGVACWRSP